MSSLLLDIDEHNVSLRELISYKEDTIVYNLSVANEHTFFVGVTGVLGHNCDIDEVMGKIVVKVPKKYCKNEQCVPFAKDLMKRLDVQGVHIKRLNYNQAMNIYGQIK